MLGIDMENAYGCSVHGGGDVPCFSVGADGSNAVTDPGHSMDPPEDDWANVLTERGGWIQCGKAVLGARHRWQTDRQRRSVVGGAKRTLRIPLERTFPPWGLALRASLAIRTPSPCLEMCVCVNQRRGSGCCALSCPTTATDCEWTSVACGSSLWRSHVFSGLCFFRGGGEVVFFMGLCFCWREGTLCSAHFRHTCAHHDDTSTHVNSSALFKTDYKSSHTCPITLQLHITGHRVEHVSKLGWLRNLVADEGKWERALSFSLLWCCLGHQQSWRVCRNS